MGYCMIVGGRGWFTIVGIWALDCDNQCVLTFLECAAAATEPTPEEGEPGQ